MSPRDFSHPAIHALAEAAGLHSDSPRTLTQREVFELSLTTSALFASACAAFFAVLNRSPSAPRAGIETILDAILEKVNSMDANLNAIANDWPTLKAAINQRLTADANTIAQLTSELASSATSSTPMTDERAAQIDADMQSVIANLTGVAQAVQSSAGPTGATGGSGVASTASPTAGATGATGSPSSTAPATPAGSTGSTGTSAAPSTGTTGSPTPTAPPSGAAPGAAQTATVGAVPNTPTTP